MASYESAEFADVGDKITNTLTIGDNGDGGSIGIRSQTTNAFGPQTDVEVSVWLAPPDLAAAAAKLAELAARYATKTKIASAGTIRDGKITETVTADQADAPGPLAEALDALERVGCQFFACEGPDKPVADMVTCYVCAAIQNLRKAIAEGGK